MEYEIQKMKKPLSVNIEKHDPNYCPKKMKTSTKGMYKIRWHVHARETRNSLRMRMLWCEKARFVICTDEQNRNQLRCNPYAWDKNTFFFGSLFSLTGNNYRAETLFSEFMCNCCIFFKLICFALWNQ